MKPKSMLLLLVAGGCGLVAALAVSRHLAGNQTPQAVVPVEPRKIVVIAAADQEAGVRLTEEMLKKVELLAKDLPEGTFSDPTEVIGQALRQPILKGELVLQGKLGEEKTLTEIIRNLPTGMLAFTAKLSNDDAPMPGMINPGDHVDVRWRQHKSGIPGGMKTLMQGVKVLAVGQRVTAGESEGPTSKNAQPTDHNSYTLMVTGHQYRRLEVSSGAIRLVPRGQGDTSDEKLDEEMLDIWLGLKEAPGEKPVRIAEAPRSAAPRTHKATFIKGNEITEEVFNLREKSDTKPTKNQ